MTSTTVPLKALTDLLAVDHDEAMQVVRRIIQDPDFGPAPITGYVSDADSAEQAQTYVLSVSQAIALASRMRMEPLMKVVTYCQDLDKATPPSSSGNDDNEALLKEIARLSAENTRLTEQFTIATKELQELRVKLKKFYSLL